MDRFTCEDFLVLYYTGKEKKCQLNEMMATYHIASVENMDISAIEGLKRQGFQFHDRILQMEIDIAATEELRKKTMEKLMVFPLEVSEVISDEMFRLGCLAFNTDRRFHLKPEFDTEISAKTLKEYIRFYNEQDIVVTRVEYDGELAGYTVIHRQDEQAENVLGATKPGILGKMVAFGLYANTIKYLYEQENYKKYYAEVSSSNTASINLHVQLGAKVLGSYDKYICIE